MTKFKAEVFDKRWVPVVEQAYVWHAKNENYFRHTENLARVAMVQSDQTATYYVPPAPQASSGNREVVPEAAQPRVGNNDYVRGFYQSLVESRVPFNLADERQLDPGYISRYKVLVLPNVAALVGQAMRPACATMSRRVARSWRRTRHRFMTNGASRAPTSPWPTCSVATMPARPISGCRIPISPCTGRIR